MFKKLFILTPLFFASPNLSQDMTPKKMDSSVQKAYFAKRPIDVIVQLKEQTDLSAAENISDRTARIQYVYDQLRLTAQNSQGLVLNELRKRKALFQPFYIVNAIAVHGATTELLQTLSQIPNVESIAYDIPSTLKIPPNEVRKDDGEPTGVESSLTFVKADQVWKMGFKGQGIVIAGQDTGYAWEHPAIKAKYRGNGATVNHTYNWHDSVHSGGGSCGADSKIPCDDHYHGTHTMGTMLGDDGGANKIGVAPEAKWMGCRNMDQGTGTPSTYLECFEFFLAPYPMGGNPQTDGRPDMAPHVISNSWSCPESEGCTGGEFYDAIKALHAAGILVVVAAGNDGPGCGTIVSPPAYSEEAVVVAAYDHVANRIASFSSRGPAAWNGAVGPDFAAPGVNIRSAVPGGGYNYLSGTSMATPHVAGAVALLWSAKPHLVGKIKETINLLRSTATPKTSTQTCGSYPGSAVPNAVFGHGTMDIYKAVSTN